MSMWTRVTVTAVHNDENLKKIYDESRLCYVHDLGRLGLIRDVNKFEDCQAFLQELIELSKKVPDENFEIRASFEDGVVEIRYVNDGVDLSGVIESDE